MTGIKKRKNVLDGVGTKFRHVRSMSMKYHYQLTVLFNKVINYATNPNARVNYHN